MPSMIMRRELLHMQQIVDLEEEIIRKGVDFYRIDFLNSNSYEGGLVEVIFSEFPQHKHSVPFDRLTQCVFFLREIRDWYINEKKRQEGVKATLNHINSMMPMIQGVASGVGLPSSLTDSVKRSIDFLEKIEKEIREDKK